MINVQPDNLQWSIQQMNSHLPYDLFSAATFYEDVATKHEMKAPAFWLLMPVSQVLSEGELGLEYIF